jgi:hypothetical protein
MRKEPPRRRLESQLPRLSLQWVHPRRPEPIAFYLTYARQALLYSPGRALERHRQVELRSRQSRRVDLNPLGRAETLASVRDAVEEPMRLYDRFR